ncbi:hypothetical protein M408DRAFT_10921 [Serendipita vermifera MAFF 305830]|uniref:Uncharacterized protein n=1 Tax=Serendipita vermifera MAFF 305830 TaxID=933852 RepID=A0A0C3AJ57_SERVB|nr:hypothetical protein M408DRAFT_10921 [Serendipita vermifera MAFF 305830]
MRLYNGLRKDIKSGNTKKGLEQEHEIANTGSKKNLSANVMMMMTLLILNVNCESVLDDTIAPAKRLHWVIPRTLQEVAPLKRGGGEFSNELVRRGLYGKYWMLPSRSGAPTGCATPSHVVCPGTDGCCPTASQCPAPGGQYCNSSGSSPPPANTPPNTPAVTPPTVTVTQPVTIANTPVNTPAITTIPSSDSSNGRLTNAAGRTNGFETRVGNLVIKPSIRISGVGIATTLPWLIARKQGDTDSINFSAIDVICKSMNVQNWLSAGKNA